MVAGFEMGEKDPRMKVFLNLRMQSELYDKIRILAVQKQQGISPTIRALLNQAIGDLNGRIQRETRTDSL